MIQQPYNLFKPAKVTPESFEHQGVQQPPQQISQPAVQAPDVLQMAAEAEQRARQTQQMPVSQPAQPAQTTSSNGNTRSINPNSETEGIDYLASMLTTPEQEEKMRKASVANQRILAIGDALRHIGNIYNTVNYAPSQQFTNPVVEEEQRYQKGKALRDAANLKYYTYQQQRAAQEQKARQWEADYQLKMADAARKAGYTEAQIKNMQDRLAQQKAYQDANIALGNRKADDAKALGEARIKESSRHNRAIEANSRAGLAENIRHHKEIESKGRSGSNSSFPVKTPYGKMTVPGRSIPQAQMNQTYSDFEKAGWIKQGEFQKRMRELGINSNADPDYVRNRIVEEIIAENGAAADYMRDNFGWQYENDTRGSGEMLMIDDEPEPYTPYQAPWSSNRGNPFDERKQQGNSNNHKSNPFG
jgi:hypothetical protein